MHIIRSNIYLMAFLTSFLIFLVSGIADARNYEEDRKALEIIDNFTNSFCKTIPLAGSVDNFELSGIAKAELNEFIKKIINLDIEGVVKYNTSE